jgi:hypothetical protein
MIIQWKKSVLTMAENIKRAISLVDDLLPENNTNNKKVDNKMTPQKSKTKENGQVVLDMKENKESD